MKVLMCGDRKWTNQKKITDRLLQFPRTTLIIEGGARGADYIVGMLAKYYGYPHANMEASWDYYGKGAGPIRNRWMLDLQPDLVIAFHSNLAESKGTKDCLEEAKRRGIPTEVIE